MPIKLNGTTIIDELTLANTDLSNLTSAGQNTISSIASSTITSGNFMKKINTTTCTAIMLENQKSTTAPFDGWMIISQALISSWSNSRIQITQSSAGGSVSMPVKSGTVIYLTGSSTVVYIFFFPEVL